MLAAVRARLKVHPHVVHGFAHLPKFFAANFAGQDLALASNVPTFSFVAVGPVGSRRRANNSTLIQVFHDQ